MTTNEEFVEEVLQELEDTNAEVDSRKPTVKKFLDTMRSYNEIWDSQILQNATFVECGSAYEGTAVSKATSYDIRVLLPRPYTAENFKLVDSHNPGLYRLQWHSNSKRPSFINRKLFLQVKELREYVFDRLTSVLKKMNRECRQWSIRIGRWIGVGSIAACITDNEQDVPVLKIRLAVSMAEPRWDDKDTRLPSALQDQVQETQWPVLYHLGCPIRFSGKNDCHLLVSANYQLLEMICMNESESVRAAVLLVKLASEDRQWQRKFGLRACHIKRVAVQHYQELHEMDA